MKLPKLIALLLVLCSGLFADNAEAFFLRGGFGVSGGGGGGSALLSLPSDAMFIYSAAQQQGYTGPSVRLRRVSDSTEQDFGWVNGRMDTASMNTFCASTSCFFSVAAYDQTGNGNNCTQTNTANQPQYLPAAAVNGYVGITFFTSTARCDIPSTVTASRQAVTVLSVDAPQATADTATLMGLDTTAANRFAFEIRGAGTTLQNNTALPELHLHGQQPDAVQGRNLLPIRNPHLPERPPERSACRFHQRDAHRRLLGTPPMRADIRITATLTCWQAMPEPSPRARSTRRARSFTRRSASTPATQSESSSRATASPGVRAPAWAWATPAA